MNTLLMTVSSAVGTLAALGISGTMLAVALTVVRRNRPEGVLLVVGIVKLAGEGGYMLHSRAGPAE